MTKYTGKQTLALEAGQHKLEVASAFPILFSVNGQPEYATGVGNSKIILRSEEPIELEIEPSEPKKVYSVNRTHYMVSRHEQLDDLPPPQPAQPENWLAQMRRKVRQEMGVTREHFGLSPYETDAPEWEENQSGQDALADSPDPEPDAEGGPPEPTTPDEPQTSSDEK